MTNCVLRPRAQQDIEDIWDYSARTWGSAQAESYIRQLQENLQFLATDPHLGQACDDIRPGYHKRGSGSHLIFYRVLHDGIDVVRILHSRQDVEQHL